MQTESMTINQTTPEYRWPRARISRFRLSVMVLMWLVATPLFAQIYKYTDENGIINYTNVKPATSQYSIKVIGCYGTCQRKVNWHNVTLDTDSYRQPIAELAVEYQVDEALLRALIHAESGFNPQATSPKGAQGLMQLMPGTQRDLGVANAYVAEDNLRGGTQYLAQMLSLFDRNVEYALAAYNAGPNAVREYAGVPPYQETREYIRRIKILHGRYAGALDGKTAASTGISVSSRTP